MKKGLKTVLIIAAIAIVGAVLLGVFGVLKWETVGILMIVVPGLIVGLIFYGAIIREIIIKLGITKNSNENEESSKITGSENLSALKESLNNLKDDLKGLFGK